MDVLLENQSLKNWFILGGIIIFFTAVLLVLNKNLSPKDKVIGVGLLLFIPPIGILYALSLLLIRKSA